MLTRGFCMKKKILLLTLCGLIGMTEAAAAETAKPAAAPATLLPFAIFGAVDNGFIIVSPSSADLTYCPAYAYITGQETTLSAVPVGSCTTLTGAKPLPTTDKWTLTNVPSSHEFFLLDNANGTIINC